MVCGVCRNLDCLGSRSPALLRAILTSIEALPCPPGKTLQALPPAAAELRPAQLARARQGWAAVVRTPGPGRRGSSGCDRSAGRAESIRVCAHAE